MPSTVAENKSGEKEVHECLRPTDLSELLKEATIKSHDSAQGTRFMKDFLKCRIKWEVFKLATAGLYYTYSALEEELERNKDNSSITALYFPELFRVKALKKDLAYLYGEEWKKIIQCPKATQEYVDRIHYLGHHKPELLVGHAYTRYMGDLSGGQVLKKVAQRALHLPSTGEGIQFYLFDNITNAYQFKQLYRARLNTLELTAETKKSIVEEAKNAYQCNMKVFEELDKIGATISKEAKDDSLLVHDGKGDIFKSLYYCAKGATTAGCPLHAAWTPSRRPVVKAIVAAFGIAVASTIVCYLM